MALFLAAVVSMAGCAPKVVDTNYSLRYPPYPVEPRIAYLRSYYGAGDELYLGFIEKLLGSSQDDLMGKPFMPVFVQDTLYVTLYNNKAIFVIDTVKNKYNIIKNFGDISFLSVGGLAVSSAGDIYLCDFGANYIYVADRAFKFKKGIGADQKLIKPYGIALDEQRNRMYVIDSGSKSLKALTLAGEFLFEFGNKPGAKAEGAKDEEVPYGYYGIAVDKRNGRIVASDTENFKIRVFDEQGRLINAFGEASDTAMGFGRLAGVAVNREGHIYASDLFFHHISMFNDEGKSLMQFGGPGLGPGRFQNPLGISFDESDRLFVADSMNGRVQVFQYLSDPWKRDHPEAYAKYKEEPPAKQEAVKQKNKTVREKH